MKKLFITTCLAVAAVAQPLVSHAGDQVASDPVVASFERMLGETKIATVPPHAETVDTDPLYRYINIVLWEKHPSSCAFAGKTAYVTMRTETGQ